MGWENTKCVSKLTFTRHNFHSSMNIPHFRRSFDSANEYNIRAEVIPHYVASLWNLTTLEHRRTLL